MCASLVIKDGIQITPAMINAVDNKFLDLSDALEQKFYLLDGTYDQIVLQMIYEALTSSSTNSQINTANAELNTALTALNTAKNALDGTFAEKTALEAAEKKLTDAQDALAALSYSGLDTAQTTLSSLISDLQMQHSSIGFDANNLQDFLNESASALLLSLAAELGPLQDELDTLNEDLLKLVEEELDDLKKDLLDLESQLSELDPEAEDYGEQREGIEKAIGEKESEIAAKESEIAAKEGEILQAESDINAKTDAINGIKNSITSAQSEFESAYAAFTAAINGNLDKSAIQNAYNNLMLKADALRNAIYNNISNSSDKTKFLNDYGTLRNSISTNSDKYFSTLTEFISFVMEPAFANAPEVNEFYQNGSLNLKYSNLQNFQTQLSTAITRIQGEYNEKSAAVNTAQTDYELKKKAYDNSTIYQTYVSRLATYESKLATANSLAAQATKMTTNDLLSLCMMASTPTPQSDGSYKIVSGISRTMNSDGNYVYSLKYSGTLSKAQYEASFTKEDSYKNLAIAHFALAIMFGKVGLQQFVLMEQLKEIEKINKAIEENNKLLKDLSNLYDNFYKKCVENAWTNYSYSVSSSINSRLYSRGLTQLPSTLYYGKYNQDGSINKGGDGGKDAPNVDVEEQGYLTQISNAQDNVRLYGDKLSTDAQLMTTKMNQYMQNANAAVSACTQVVKSIGDYYKTVISNVR